MQVILEIPDKFLQLDQAKNSLSQQVKLLSALLLFQSGQLSRGAACEFELNYGDSELPELPTRIQNYQNYGDRITVELR